MGGIDLTHIDVAYIYLFGEVKFLHLLLLLMALDILTGLTKAWRNKNLWSRKSLFGFARKLLVLVMIIVANVIDQILNLGGTLTFATCLFYIANEALSITENMAQLGVLVPKNLAEKLKHIESSTGDTDTIRDEISEELAGRKVDEELNEKGRD